MFEANPVRTGAVYICQHIYIAFQPVTHTLWKFHSGIRSATAAIAPSYWLVELYILKFSYFK
jgi:hypothetical protein